MLHDIMPHQFRNEFEPRTAKAGDYILIFDHGKVALKEGEERLEIPCYEEMTARYPDIDRVLIYLFSIDEKAFYTAYKYELPEGHQMHWKAVRFFREFQPQWLGFAGITAHQLDTWYRNHKFCGCCGAVMEHSEKERALECRACGLTEYPKISPVVIVGVTDGERLLMTKYAGREYSRYALIAGFVEIGETLEGAVAREVMEEAGVKVKNIRYVGSQPWAFSDSLIAGFLPISTAVMRLRLTERNWPWHTG